MEGSHLSEKGKIDLEIVNRAKSGDQTAFTELLQKYRDPVYYIVLKIIKKPTEADDVAMDSLGKAFNNIHQYSPKYAFSTWLFKIASNNSIDFIRKKRVSLTSLDNSRTDREGNPMEFQVEGKDPTPESVFIKKQKIEAMREVVERLKPRYCQLIKLRYFEELQYDEIAEQLDLPLGTVKAQLFRARDALSKMIEKTKDSI